MGVSWLHLDVRSASIAAGALMVVAVAVRPVHRRWAAFLAGAAFETALVCGLFALWQLANALTHTHAAGGLAHGRAIWHAERVLRIPDEASFQNLMLGHPVVVRAANYYYATAHLTGIVLFLCWLWLRHRAVYTRWRNILVVFTGVSLLIQAIPVAPPRMIPSTGLVDTAMVYHQSVYAVIGSNLADQYAAMPSIHVGWAVLIAAAALSCSRSRWRWLAVGHAVVTAYVVVATANHYWLDGMAACALLGLAWAVERATTRLVTRVRLVRLTRSVQPAAAGAPVAVDN